MGIFGKIASAVAGPLVGGLFGMKSQQDNRRAAKDDLGRQRQWALDDREYNRRQFNKARDIARRDAGRVTRDERRYVEGFRDEQREYDRDALMRLREDAKAAGFNPLSVLGHTGGRYGSGTMVNPAMSMGSPGSFSAPQGEEWQPVALPALASMDFLGDAIGAGVQTWFNRENLARDEEAHALQVAIMREELDQMQREPVQPYENFGYSIPQVVSNGPTTTGRTAEVPLPSLMDWEADPVVTEPFFKRSEISPGRPVWVPQADDADEFIMKTMFAVPQIVWDNPFRIDRLTQRFMDRSKEGEHWDFGSRGAPNPSAPW